MTAKEMFEELGYKERKEAIKLCDEMLSILYHYDDRKIWEDMKDILNKGSDENV